MSTPKKVTDAKEAVKTFLEQKQSHVKKRKAARVAVEECVRQAPCGAAYLGLAKVRDECMLRTLDMLTAWISFQLHITPNVPAGGLGFFRCY